MGNVAARDVLVCSGGEDPPEAPFPGTTGGGQLHVGEALLRFPGIRVPAGLAEVGESVSGGFRESHGKGPPQLDKDGEVVGVESGQG